MPTVNENQHGCPGCGACGNYYETGDPYLPEPSADVYAPCCYYPTPAYDQDGRQTGYCDNCGGII